MSTDATLICIDCGGIFPFTAKDQDYFRDHNYSTPIRCKACRLKWRQQRTATESGPTTGKKWFARDLLGLRPGSGCAF
jgi:DNA-directed RNA polymerase subunit RPC12/RpoP